MATANDVAAYIMGQAATPITTMKLQKLLYYSQGWSLAWDGQPLFTDEIAAWANGPVIYSVFKNHRGDFRIPQPPVPVLVAAETAVQRRRNCTAHLPVCGLRGGLTYPQRFGEQFTGTGFRAAFRIIPVGVEQGWVGVRQNDPRHLWALREGADSVRRGVVGVVLVVRRVGEWNRVLDVASVWCYVPAVRYSGHARGSKSFVARRLRIS